MALREHGQIRIFRKHGKRWINPKTGKCTIISALEDVTLHLEVTVFGAEVDLGSQHHLDVRLLLRRQLRRRLSCCSRRHRQTLLLDGMPSESENGADFGQRRRLLIILGRLINVSGRNPSNLIDYFAPATPCSFREKPGHFRSPVFANLAAAFSFLIFHTPNYLSLWFLLLNFWNTYHRSFCYSR